MTTLTSLLVGMHFRPPAKQVLAVLPSGYELVLQPEPENPYDQNALKVLCYPSGIPKEVVPSLEDSLEGTGFTVNELFEAEDPFWLGYVAASDGKPLIKAGLSCGNKEFLAMLATGEAKATLGFGPDGSPRVNLTQNLA